MSNISRFIGNERGDKICHEDDGCPTELAVLKRFWREKQASSLPEEVDNLVELLDNCSVPCEDILGVALSLVGRVKQYEKIKTGTLREQVEKLAKELDNVKQVEFPRRVQKVTDALKRKHEKELAALAEQNEKQKDALLYVMRATCLSADDNPDSPIGMLYKRASNAYELPDLASPVLNSIPKEPTLPVFDADSPRFRQEFDEAVQEHNLPGKRKGEGYRSPITQWCFEIAYSVVNRLRLYEK